MYIYSISSTIKKKKNIVSNLISFNFHSTQSKKMASPEEQVLTYELKSQLLRNVEMQNHRLKTELTLHEKMTEAKMLNQQNKRLADDNTMSKTNTLRLMKMFEKKAKDG